MPALYAANAYRFPGTSRQNLMSRIEASDSFPDAMPSSCDLVLLFA